MLLGFLFVAEVTIPCFVAVTVSRRIGAYFLYLANCVVMICMKVVIAEVVQEVPITTDRIVATITAMYFRLPVLFLFLEALK